MHVSEISKSRYVIALMDVKDHGKGYIALFDGRNIIEAKLGNLKPIFIGDFTAFYLAVSNF